MLQAGGCRFCFPCYLRLVSRQPQGKIRGAAVFFLRAGLLLLMFVCRRYRGGGGGGGPGGVATGGMWLSSPFIDSNYAVFAARCRQGRLYCFCCCCCCCRRARLLPLPSLSGGRSRLVGGLLPRGRPCCYCPGLRIQVTLLALPWKAAVAACCCRQRRPLLVCRRRFLLRRYSNEWMSSSGFYSSSWRHLTNSCWQWRDLIAVCYRCGRGKPDAAGKYSP